MQALQKIEKVGRVSPWAGEEYGNFILGKGAESLHPYSRF